MSIPSVQGQLDASGLASPSHLDLGLDDDRVAGLVGLGYGLVDGVGDSSGRHRDAVVGEVLLALVFVQVHSTLLWFVMGTARYIASSPR
jgi:hypothetical protein